MDCNGSKKSVIKGEVNMIIAKIPTITAGAGIGTGGSVTVEGNQDKGQFTLITGSNITSDTAGEIVMTMTIPSQMILSLFPAAGYASPVLLFPLDSLTASIDPGTFQYTASFGLITIKLLFLTASAGFTTLANSTTYTWQYVISD